MGLRVQLINLILGTREQTSPRVIRYLGEIEVAVDSYTPSTPGYGIRPAHADKPGVVPSYSSYYSHFVMISNTHHTSIDSILHNHQSGSMQHHNNNNTDDTNYTGQLME